MPSFRISPTFMRGFNDENGSWKHDLHFRPLAPQGFAAQIGQRFAKQTDLPGCRLDQAQNGARQRGLAATGFANQRQRFAGRNLQADAIHRFDMVHGAFQQAFADREMHRRSRTSSTGLGICVGCAVRGQLALFGGIAHAYLIAFDQLPPDGSAPNAPVRFMEGRRLNPAALEHRGTTIGKAAADELRYPAPARDPGRLSSRSPRRSRRGSTANSFCV
jgi:hypothetical protein